MIPFVKNFTTKATTVHEGISLLIAQPLPPLMINTPPTTKTFTTEDTEVHRGKTTEKIRYGTNLCGSSSVRLCVLCGEAFSLKYPKSVASSRTCVN